jgi:biopolymer transport protein ExbD
MQLRFQCPQCNHVGSVHERMHGRSIHCPRCEAAIRIPDREILTDGDIVPFDDEQPLDVTEFLDSDDPQPVLLSNEEISESDELREPADDELPIKVVFEKKELPKDDMDMTPMVDVTFLLLIFFMITASFTTEKALQQQASTEQPSTQAQPQDETDTIKILIDEFNAYTVIFPDGGESEATSKQELITVLKMADLDGSSEDASNLVIEAHEDSVHAAVVGALDAGRQNKLTRFKVNIVETLD